MSAIIRDRVRANEAEKAGKPAPEPEDVSDRVHALWDRPPALIEHAQAMQDCLDDYERLDKLDIATEVRLRAALADLEHYREGLGRQLRQAVEQVIEGEVNEFPVSANAAVSQKDIPVEFCERATLVPEAANPGALAVVESSSPVAVVLVPADEIFGAPVGVSTAEMADGHVGEVECPAASGREAMVVSDSLPSASATITADEEATPSVTATMPA